jgi:RNA polymerase sigma factor (sigma-70 family)
VGAASEDVTGGVSAPPEPRALVERFLFDPDRDAVSGAVTEILEMVESTEEIPDSESALLQRESERARGLDRELAGELEHPRPAGATGSAGYLREVSGRPRMPAAVERGLVVAAQTGDRRAREQLVEACLPLIAGVARMYRGSATISRLELLQEGVVGLLRALERYDPDREVAFWAYASWWVRQAMQQLVAELTRPMVLSDRSLRQLSALKRAHRAYLAEHRQEPTVDQLADQTGLSHTQVGDLVAVDQVPRSLQQPINDTDGAVGTFGELLEDPLAEDAYERLLDESEIEQVRALLASLNDRERMILRARYGLDGPEQSLRELGERIGVSAERVRQIEQRALGKLRAAATRSAPG